MIKLLALCCCLLLSACAGIAKNPLPTSARVVKQEVKPLVGSFHVHSYQLGNGLKLLVVVDHSSPTFAYQTWFAVGSHYEVPGKTGLAHLFEHLMFKATRNHPEGQFDRLLESAGVEDENAFTSWDYTAYVQELPKDKLNLIASLESDRMVNLRVNENSFKTERKVVQNERRYRNVNNPDGVMSQDLFALAFKVSPYKWPVIGYSKDLEHETAQDALNFYHQHYSPNHATVVVSGDVDPMSVVSTVQKYYGGIPAQHVIPHAIPVEPPQTHPRHQTVALNIQVEKLVMGYHIPDVESPDMPALLILDSVLTGGKSSRLQRALVDTGIASDASTMPMEQQLPSLFIFQCDLQKNKHAAVAESAILRVLARLRKQPISNSELQRAKHLAEFAFYDGLDGNAAKANFLGEYETLTGDFERGIEIQDEMMAVTPLQLQKVVRKYFEPNQRTVITGVMK